MTVNENEQLTTSSQQGINNQLITINDQSMFTQKMVNEQFMDDLGMIN